MKKFSLRRKLKKEGDGGGRERKKEGREDGMVYDVEETANYGTRLNNNEQLSERW